MVFSFYFTNKSLSVLPVLIWKPHNKLEYQKNSLYTKNQLNRSKTEDFDFFMIFSFYFTNKSPSVLPVLIWKPHDKLEFPKKSLQTKNQLNRGKIKPFMAK